MNEKVYKYACIVLFVFAVACGGAAAIVWNLYSAARGRAAELAAAAAEFERQLQASIDEVSHVAGDITEARTTSEELVATSARSRRESETSGNLFDAAAGATAEAARFLQTRIEKSARYECYIVDSNGDVRCSPYGDDNSTSNTMKETP